MATMSGRDAGLNDGQLEGFSFGRTSALDPSRATGRARRASISTATSDTGSPSFTSAASSRTSTTNSTSRHGSSNHHYSSRQPYFPPPGLSNGSLTTSKSRHERSSRQKPRHARVEYEPMLPAAAQWLLHTTPPPPPSRHQTPWTSSIANPDVVLPGETAPPTNSRPAGDSSVQKVSWGRKRLAALGLAGGRNGTNAAVESLTAGFATTSLRQEPDRVQFRLGGGNGQSNITLRPDQPRILPSRSGRLDSRTEADRLPRSWHEYTEAYARGHVDIEDPPFPPITTIVTHESGRPSPYQSGAFDAPPSSLEHIRQRMLATLDLLGVGNGQAGGVSASMAPAPSGASSRSSTGHSSTSHHRDSLFSSASRRDSTPASSIYSSPALPFPSFPTGQTHKSPAGPTGQAAASTHRRSMHHHPVLLNVLAHSRRLFGQPRVTMISILEAERQVLLANEGMPDQVESLPRQAGLCAHTILNGEKGLVVLDTQRDWRFRNSLLSTVMNARFYAGMPIYGPPDPVLEEEAGGRIAIGTVAIIDDEPRLDFSSAERAKLRALAAEVTNEIAAFVREQRQLAPLGNAQTYGDFPSNQSHPPLSASSAYGRRGSKTDSLPPTPPISLRRPSVQDDVVASEDQWSTAAAASTLTTMPEEPPVSLPVTKTHRRRGSRSQEQQPDTAQLAPSSDGVARSNSATSRSSTTSSTRRRSTRAVFPSDKTRPLPNASSSPRSSHRPLSPQQKLFDSATNALGKSCNLSLVYLVSLDLTDELEMEPALSLLSAYGLASATSASGSKPSFDPALHLKALRAPEGGLLFKNPAYASGQTATTPATAFASGILLPVTELEVERQGSSTKIGWVLAGYTKDAEREFGEDELDAFVTVIEQLRKVVVWAAEAEADAGVGRHRDGRVE